jgi:hypothetical protein
MENESRREDFKGSVFPTLQREWRFAWRISLSRLPVSVVVLNNF